MTKVATRTDNRRLAKTALETTFTLPQIAGFDDQQTLSHTELGMWE